MLEVVLLVGVGVAVELVLRVEIGVEDGVAVEVVEEEGVIRLLAVFERERLGVPEIDTPSEIDDVGERDGV